MIFQKDFKRNILFAVLMAGATSGSVALVGTFVRNGLTWSFPLLWWRSFRIGYFVVVFCILFFAPPIQRFVNRVVK
jgi:uncharacterized protein (DUF2062 family)